MARYSGAYVKEQIAKSRRQTTSSSNQSVVMQESVPASQQPYRPVPTERDPDYWYAVGQANALRIARKGVTSAEGKRGRRPELLAMAEAEYAAVEQSIRNEGYDPASLGPLEGRFRHINNPGQYAGTSYAQGTTAPKEVKYSQPGSLTGGGVQSKTGTKEGVGLSEGFYVGGKGEQVYITKGKKSERTAAQGVAALNRTIAERPGEAATYGRITIGRERANVQAQQREIARQKVLGTTFQALNLPREAAASKMREEERKNNSVEYGTYRRIKPYTARLFGRVQQTALEAEGYARGRGQNLLSRGFYKGSGFVAGSVAELSGSYASDPKVITRDIALGAGTGYVFGRTVQTGALVAAKGGYGATAILRAGRATEYGLTAVGLGSLGISAYADPEGFKKELAHLPVQAVAGGFAYSATVGKSSAVFAKEQALSVDSRMVAQFRKTPSAGLTGRVKTKVVRTSYGVVEEIPVEGGFIAAAEFVGPRTIKGTITTEFETGLKGTKKGFVGETAEFSAEFTKKDTLSVISRKNQELYIQTVGRGKQGGRLGDISKSRGSIVELQRTKYDTYAVIRTGKTTGLNAYTPYTKINVRTVTRKQYSITNINVGSRVLQNEGIAIGQVGPSQAGPSSIVDRGYRLAVREKIISRISVKTVSETFSTRISRETRQLFGNRRGSYGYELEITPSEVTQQLPRRPSGRYLELERGRNVFSSIPAPALIQPRTGIAAVLVPRFGRSSGRSQAPRIIQQPRFGLQPKSEYSPISATRSAFKQIPLPKTEPSFAQVPRQTSYTLPRSRGVFGFTSPRPLSVSSLVPPRGGGFGGFGSGLGTSLTQRGTSRKFGYSKTLYEVTFNLGGRRPRKVRGGYTGFEITRSR